MESTDLRKAGLKVTHPRMRILEILESHDGKHLTAEVARWRTVINAAGVQAE